MRKLRKLSTLGDTHEYEYESTSYDDIVVKAEDAERREARKPNDIVVTAEDAEHREAREPIEKAEEAEHTRDTHEFESTGYDDNLVKAEDAEHREARETIEKAEETEIVVTAKDAEHKEARETIEKAEETEHIGDTHEDEIESTGNDAIVVIDDIDTDSSVVEKSLPTAPAQLDKEQWDIMGLVGTMFKGLHMV